MRLFVYNIQWDREVDGEIDTFAVLHNAVAFTLGREAQQAFVDGDGDDLISDALSEEYGFCVLGYNQEVMDDDAEYAGVNIEL